MHLEDLLKVPVTEDDHDSRRRLSTDEAALVFGAVQCLLAAASLWLQLRAGRKAGKTPANDPAVEQPPISIAVRQHAAELGAQLDAEEAHALAKQIAAAGAEDAVLVVRGYEITVSIAATTLYVDGRVATDSGRQPDPSNSDD